MNSASELIMMKQAPGRKLRSAYMTQGQQLLHVQLSVVRAEPDSDWKVVGKIQRSLLSETLPSVSGFDIASYYQSSGMVSGDYFDLVAMVGGCWGLAVVDVAGHGASAARVMAVMRTLAHAHPPHAHFLQSDKFLTFMNRQMTCNYLRDGWKAC